MHQSEQTDEYPSMNRPIDWDEQRRQYKSDWIIRMQRSQVDSESINDGSGISIWKKWLLPRPVERMQNKHRSFSKLTCEVLSLDVGNPSPYIPDINRVLYIHRMRRSNILRWTVVTDLIGNWMIALWWNSTSLVAFNSWLLKEMPQACRHWMQMDGKDIQFMRKKCIYVLKPC